MRSCGNQREETNSLQPDGSVKPQPEVQQLQIDGTYGHSNRILLTAQEKNVLYWTAEGKTHWEVGAILGISETTVITHLKNSRIKLRATNKTHAIVEAIRQSQIPLFKGRRPISHFIHDEPVAFDITCNLAASDGLRMSPDQSARLPNIDVLLDAAGDVGEFFTALDQTCTVLGFDALILSCHKSTREALLLDPTYCSIPLNVMREYKRMNLIENDVLLAQLIGCDRPFVWDSTYDRYRDGRSQCLLEFLRQFRFTMGIIVPLEDEVGFRSFLGLLASVQRIVDVGTFNAVCSLGKKAQIKAVELGL